MTIDNSPTLDLDQLKAQQAALRSRGRLGWLHWGILGMSGLITIIAWNTSQSLLEQRVEQHFEREVGRVLDLMKERMKHYEDALLSGAAKLASADQRVTHEEWRRYAGNLDLVQRYPGINGIGVILHLEANQVDEFVERRRQTSPGFDIRPKTEFDFSLPIVFIEPEAPNAAAIGLDVAFETNRRNAAMQARQSGATRISGPIILVQDEGKTPGFLFYAPYYVVRNSRPMAERSTDTDRESTFGGLVYAPLVVKKLVAGTLGQQNRDVIFSIRDGGDVLYDELGDGRNDGKSGRVAARFIEFYGRTWTFDFEDATVQAVATNSYQPWVVLIGGLTVDAMLLLMFWLMGRSNRAMVKLAETMTADLSSHAGALASSNEELKNYAHIVSHDLKAPIHGIQVLTTFLGEDLETYMASEDANPDVASNLTLIARLVEKGDTLINGVLNYSSVGVLEEKHSLVNIGELVQEIADTIGLRPDQVIVEGEVLQFETQAFRLGQVLQNLIGNSQKYHDDSSQLRVNVRVRREAEFHRIEIIDNGPGIESCFHERIFQPFTTLGTKPESNNSGVGLSIVQKSVELLGGSVSVESALGQGANFTFYWPVATVRLAA